MVLAIHLMAGALAAPPAAAVSLALGSSALTVVAAFGTDGALAIVASGVAVAVRVDHPKRRGQ